MNWDTSPEAVGRLHAIQRLAEAAETLAATRAPRDGLDAADAAYMAAYAATCRSIAQRLRTSAGAQP
jgi:hypothetical protein